MMSPTPMAYNWSGFYFGAHGGYAFADGSSFDDGAVLGGQVGVEGEAKAAVDVSWTPKAGVDLLAEASLEAHPVFKFDVTGSVLVEADLLIDTITLYEKKWSLASFEYGSQMTFGVAFPIHYKEGESFNVSADDLKFTVPEIDPGSLLSDLVGRIA